MIGKIAAALVGGEPGREDVTLAALAGQTRAPDDRLAGADLGTVCNAALATGTDWVWLLERGTWPEPDALERLLEVLEGGYPLPEPVLLASRIVGPTRELDPAATPVIDTRKFALVADTFSHGLIPLRVARTGSLLVNVRALERAPRETHDMVWTARLLRRAPGVLVPASVAVRETPASHAPLALRARLALLFSDALALYEKPWFAFQLLEEGVAAARRAIRGESPPRSPASDVGGSTRGSNEPAPTRR